MKAPRHLFIHTASVTTPSVGNDNGMDINVGNSVTTRKCRVEDPSSSRQLSEGRIAGVHRATGCFDIADGDLTTGTILVVTGPGLPAPGRTYRVEGPANNSAGAGVMYVVDLSMAEGLT
ncbi:MAG: hypothetical protein KGR25_00170 [Chloroflexi bacterium]|nr:hypothetical protein [Chloroflexota bacterium]